MERKCSVSGNRVYFALVVEKVLLPLAPSGRVNRSATVGVLLRVGRYFISTMARRTL